MADRTVPDRGVAVAKAKLVELFWAPGSTSSLRMREFVEKSGVPYELVNLAENPDRRRELEAQGIKSSAARVGDHYVNGSNLDRVAELIGVAYSPPEILPPRELVARYWAISAALRRHVCQITAEFASERSPDQGRTVLGLAHHASSVMRIFLRDYNRDSWDSDDYHTAILESRGAADEVPGLDVVLERLDDTVSRFWNWWREYGEQDPLERVMPLYWGEHTLHEALERETWHTAHHTRQLAYLLEERGMEPDHPLSAKDLEGLPLPERLYG